MPISVSWYKDGVEWTCTDTVTIEQVRDADDLMFKDPRFEKAKYLLINTLAVKNVELTELEIQMDATYDSIHALRNEKLKLAFLVGTPDTRSVAETYASISKKKHIGWNVKIFSNIEELLEWLKS